LIPEIRAYLGDGVVVVDVEPVVLFGLQGLPLFEQQLLAHDFLDSSVFFAPSCVWADTLVAAINAATATSDNTFFMDVRFLFWCDEGTNFCIWIVSYWAARATNYVQRLRIPC
jgi:hypothetical protein